MPKIAVIGLGRFGMSLARQLGASGAEVIAIDKNQQLIAEIRDEVSVAVRMDSTDEIALRSQDVQHVDTCVVAIGENFEASLLTTVIVKRMGVPEVICRAQTQFHAEIFRQVGADDVIQPEIQAGIHMGHCLANEHINDFITLPDGYTLIELRAPSRFQDKSLRQLDLRAKFEVNLVAIRRETHSEQDGETVVSTQTIGVIRPDDRIEQGDVLVLVGTDEALARLPRE